MWGGGVSCFFPVNAGVRQGCVLAPSLFNTCMDWVLGRVMDRSRCGASVGNTTVTDLVFADDVVIVLSVGHLRSQSYFHVLSYRSGTPSGPTEEAMLLALCLIA